MCHALAEGLRPGCSSSAGGEPAEESAAESVIASIDGIDSVAAGVSAAESVVAVMAGFVAEDQCELTGGQNTGHCRQDSRPSRPLGVRILTVSN